MSADVVQMRPGAPRKLKTPYAHLVPPLSSDERASLEASLRDDGQQAPVLIDEGGNILDGHNRYDILGDGVACRVIGGKTEPEKRAMVLRSATGRRNMSEAQKAEALELKRAIAFELRAEDPRKNTQQRIADQLGVKQPTVSKWFSSNIPSYNDAKPDARVKLSPEQKRKAVQLVEDGATQAKAAEATGMSQRSVSEAVAAAKAEGPVEYTILDGQHRLPAAPEEKRKRKPRRIPLFGVGLEAIRVAEHRRKAGCRYVFPTPRDNQRRADKSAPTRWHKWLEAAGIARSVRWYDLRHTCATSLLAGWWGPAWRLEEIQQLLGHASRTTTERYAHRLAESLMAAGRRVEFHGLTDEGPKSRASSGIRTPDLRFTNPAYFEGFSGLVVENFHRRSMARESRLAAIVLEATRLAHQAGRSPLAKAKLHELLREGAGLLDGDGGVTHEGVAGG